MSLGLYSPDQENDIYIRRQAETWRRSELITDKQLRLIQDKCIPQLRQTNLFFRILFFVFTLLCVGAIVGLAVWLMESQGTSALTVILFLCSAVSLTAAWYLVTKYRFYRHGMEEALALAGMLLCLGGLAGFLRLLGVDSHTSSIIASLVLSGIACFVYLRFGYLYAAAIGIMALCAIPFQFSFSSTTERLMLLGILCCVFGLWLYRDKSAVHDFEKDRNTMILACLLGALYLTINLHIFGIIGQLAGGIPRGHFHPDSFPRPFYWISYILTFLVPAAAVGLGIKSRRRLILNAGLAMVLASLATNKSYLGLTRNPWDPAVLGAGLIIFSLFLTRWLNAGPDRQRGGFTACEILKPENSGVSLADAAAALTPAALGTGQAAHEHPSESYTGEGSSGGGGAQRNI